MTTAQALAFGALCGGVALAAGALTAALRHPAPVEAPVAAVPVVDVADLTKPGFTPPDGAWIAGPRLPEAPEPGRLYIRMGDELVTVCVLSGRLGTSGPARGWNCSVAYTGRAP